jgi:hypothetical protein
MSRTLSDWRCHTSLCPSPHPQGASPSTDIGIDLVGYTFTDRALGRCKVLAPSTYTDENNTVWNTLELTSSTYPNETQFSNVSEVRAWIKKTKNNHRAPSPTTSIHRSAFASTFNAGAYLRALTTRYPAGPQHGPSTAYPQIRPPQPARRCLRQSTVTIVQTVGPMQPCFPSRGLIYTTRSQSGCQRQAAHLSLG